MQPFNPATSYQQALIAELMKGANINKQYMDQGMEVNPGQFPDVNAMMPNSYPPLVKDGVDPAWSLPENASYQLPWFRK